MNLCEDETKPYDDYAGWRDAVFGEYYVRDIDERDFEDKTDEDCEF